MLLLAAIVYLSLVVTVKKTAWQVFQQYHTDLIGFGKSPLTDHIVMSTEKFICKMYGVPDVDTCNKARVKLFCIGRAHKTVHQPRVQQRSTSYEHTIKQVSGTKLTCHVLIFCLSLKWVGCT